jgi:hypothetical protein
MPLRDMRIARSAKVLVGLGLISLLGLTSACSRPDHKYRLTIEIDTPQGVKSAAGVMAVHRDSVSVGGMGGGTAVQGDAIFLDLGGGRNLVAILGHGKNGSAVDGMNHLAMNAFAAAGQRVPFNEVKQLNGKVQVQGDLIPTLVTFADLADPKTARVLDPARIDAAFGSGYRLKRVTLEMVPVGFWPLGEPVTRGIETKLPFLVSQKDSLRRIIDDMPPRFQPHYHLFER